MSDAARLISGITLITVPTIVYGEMPWLQRARVWLLTRR